MTSVRNFDLFWLRIYTKFHQSKTFFLIKKSPPEDQAEAGTPHQVRLVDGLHVVGNHPSYPPRGRPLDIPARPQSVGKWWQVVYNLAYVCGCDL
jgi:hypothetical protein